MGRGPRMSSQCQHGRRWYRPCSQCSAEREAAILFYDAIRAAVSDTWRQVPAFRDMSPAHRMAIVVEAAREAMPRE